MRLQTVDPYTQMMYNHNHANRINAALGRIAYDTNVIKCDSGCTCPAGYTCLAMGKCGIPGNSSTKIDQKCGFAPRTKKCGTGTCPAGMICNEKDGTCSPNPNDPYQMQNFPTVNVQDSFFNKLFKNGIKIGNTTIPYVVVLVAGVLGAVLLFGRRRR